MNNEKLDDFTFTELQKLLFKDKTPRYFGKIFCDSFDEYVQRFLNLIQDKTINIIYFQAKQDVLTQIVYTFKDLKISKFPIKDKNFILFPNICQQSGLTYQKTITYKQIIFYEQILKNDGTQQETEIYRYPPDEEAIEDSPLMNLPIMVGSQNCISNNGYPDCVSQDNPCGYFIIKGQIKSIVAVERMSDNEIVVYKTREGNYISRIKSRSFVDHFTNINNFDIVLINKEQSKSKTKIKDFIRELIVETIQFNKQLEQDKRQNDKKKVHVFHLFYAFGIEQDEKIIKMCSLEDADVQLLVIQILKQFKNQSQINTKEKAIKFLESLKSEKIDQKNIKTLLIKNILPHVSLYDDETQYTQKAEFIGYMVYKLLMFYLKKTNEEDRDHQMYKRLLTPGELLFQLSEQYYKHHVKQVRGTIRNQEQINGLFLKNNHNFVSKILLQTKVQSEIQKALCNGKWSQKMEGVTQPYDAKSLNQALLLSRRVSNNPVWGQQKKMKLQPRFIDMNQFGMKCPIESKEGPNCGAVHSLCITTIISHDQDVNVIEKSIKNIKLYGEEYGLNVYNYEKIKNNYVLIIAGMLLYTLQKPQIFIQKFREMRFKGEISKYTSYYINNNTKEIQLFFDGGRYMRPFVVVENNKPKLDDQLRMDIINNKYENYKQFINQHRDVIEIMDVKEISCQLVAENILQLKKEQEQNTNTFSSDIQNQNLFQNSYKLYSHCEIHPINMLGVISSSITFIDHAPGARAVHSFAHRKATIQQQLPDFFFSHVKKQYALVGGQRNLQRSRMSDITGVTKYKCGHHLIVSITMRDGTSQEDSIIMKQSTAKRLFLQTYEDVFETQLEKISKELRQRFGKPDQKQQQLRNPEFNYDKIDEGGLIAPGTIVRKNDIIIGKYEVIQNNNENRQTIVKKCCSIPYMGNQGIVVQSIQRSEEGVQKIIVKIKDYNIPEIGDKFALGHGQKATIGNIYNDENMPYYEDGTVPDVIFNLHSLSTRMTISVLLEGFINHLAVHKAQIIDSSPFSSNHSLEDTYKFFENSEQKKYIYDPVNGKRRGMVFQAILYYYALEQKSKDKLYAVGFQESTKTMQMRHPKEGKQWNGANKIAGEMEKSIFLSHGNPYITKEIQDEHSDGYTIHVCDTCGRFATRDIQDRKFLCKYCNGKSIIKQVVTSYATSQMIRFMSAQGMQMQIITQDTQVEQQFKSDKYYNQL